MPYTCGRLSEQLPFLMFRAFRTFLVRFFVFRTFLAAPKKSLIWFISDWRSFGSMGTGSSRFRTGSETWGTWFISKRRSTTSTSFQTGFPTASWCRSWLSAQTTWGRCPRPSEVSSPSSPSRLTTTRFFFLPTPSRFVNLWPWSEVIKRLCREWLEWSAHDPDALGSNLGACHSFLMRTCGSN